MIEASYVSIEEFAAADLATCGDGLFQGFRDPFQNVIVTTAGGTRYAIYLDDPQGCKFVKLPTGGGGGRAGISWPTPSIEVDTATQFDPDRSDERVGDLILEPHSSIVAASTDGWRDAQRMPLWAGTTSSGKSVGFKGWRFISVRGDSRRVIYTRTAQTG